MLRTIPETYSTWRGSKMNKKIPASRLTHPECSIAFIAILLYTAIILTLAGCSEDSDEPEPTAVTGKVLPIGSGAIVKLVRNDIVVDSADVDPEGNYAFSDLLGGQYDLVIMSGGYITRSHTFQVVEGQITQIGVITLEKAPPSAVIVTGKVIDSQTGEPIADALILVEYEESGTTTFTYTREDGRFTISIQTDLSPAITVSKAGYEPSEINAGDVDNIEVDLKRTSGYVPPPDGSVGLKVGDMAPDFTLPKLDGGTLSLHDTRGKVVFIDFWATWCGPCKAAIPHLQKLYGKYKSQGLIVLGIDVWEYSGVDAVKRFKDDNRLTYDILLGTDTGVDSLYEVRGIPTMWLLDRNGVITWAKLGFGSGGEVEMEKQIKAALALQ
jgi:thiol-disulfide isomerase/thioredoxin